MQERRNSIANALEFRLSCINPSKYLHVLYFFKSWHFITCLVSPYVAFKNELFSGISWDECRWIIGTDSIKMMVYNQVKDN